jgi:hypothetical protein
VAALTFQLAADIVATSFASAANSRNDVPPHGP